MPHGDDVAAGVGRLEVAIAPVVADAVDDAGGRDRDPEHLHRPDGRADRAEQQQVDDQHQADALPAEARIEVALEPVVGRAVAELGERLLVLGLGCDRARCRCSSTVLMPRVCGLCGSSSVSHLAWCLRWIATHSLVTMPVVEPEPEAEEMRRDAVQVERAVRLRAVQEDRHRGDRDVRGDQRVGDDLPAAEAGEAVAQPLHQRIENRDQHVHPSPFSTLV